MARALHLQRLASRWYYLLTRPKGDVVRLGVGGVDAQFYARTSRELRAMELEILVEKDSLELLVSTLRPGSVVYEIGANTGLLTVIFANAGAQVFAFEPMNENFSRLQENLDLNRITSVRSFQKALADWSGEGKLYLPDRNAISLGANFVRPLAGRPQYQMVQVVEGDILREAEHLPCPDSVHIDVEGYEYSVILGLQRTLAQPTCHLVCCEVHPGLLPKGVDAGMVLGLLRSLGFGHIDTFARYGAFHLVAHKDRVQ